MKKYIFIILVFLNYSVTYAEENPFTAIAWDIAWWGIDMAIKIGLYVFPPLLLISLIIIYLKKR